MYRIKNHSLSQLHVMITELIRKDGLRKQTISQQGNQTQQR